VKKGNIEIKLELKTNDLLLVDTIYRKMLESMTEKELKLITNAEVTNTVLEIQTTPEALKQDETDQT